MMFILCHKCFLTEVTNFTDVNWDKSGLGFTLWCYVMKRTVAHLLCLINHNY